VPRRRRFPKRRAPIPQGLAEITLLERTRWTSHGPLVESDIDLDDPAPAGYVLWESWDAWATFCADVRDELYAERPWLRERSAAERLYHAWVAGANVDIVRRQIEEMRAATDPRLLLDVR
jgi:hypothetical protein